MMSKLSKMGPKKVAMIGGGGLVAVVVLVVVLVLVVGRGPTGSASPDDAVRSMERALLAGNVNSLVALAHPSERAEIKEAMDEGRAQLGDAAFRGVMEQAGRALATRKLVFQDEREARYEYEADYGTETITLRYIDGRWWLID